MNERRGYVVLIRRGDPEICGGIAEGIMKAREQGNDGDLIRQRCALPPSPKGEGRGDEAPPMEHVEVVEAEIDRQRIQRALLRVAVGNHNTAEDYRNMMTKARGDYAIERRPGTLRRFGEKLLSVYALAVLAVSAAYRAQDRVLVAGCGSEAPSSVSAGGAATYPRGEGWGRR